MRKFLLALCLLLSGLAAAADLPLIASLTALRAPTQALVREAAKGSAADFEALAKSCVAADQAWNLAKSETLDLARYGVPAERHEEIWRQIRMLGLIVGYLEEGAKRGDRALVLRAAGMLEPAYEKLAASMGVR